MTAAAAGGVRSQAAVRPLLLKCSTSVPRCLDDMMLPDPLIAMVPGHVARTYQIVPVEVNERNEKNCFGCHHRTG